MSPPTVGRARALPSDHALSGARVGRVVLGLCFVLDAGWYVASYDVRAAYFQASLSPDALIWLTVAVYLTGGVALALGRAIEKAALSLGLMLVVTTLVMYPVVRAGGIGEFPPELWYEVGFKEIAVHIAIIGALLLAVASPAASAARGPRSLAPIAGRVLIGGYFIVNALWQWYFFDIRVQHLIAAGRSGTSLPVMIALQLAAGTLIVTGIATRIATVPLMLIITVSTIVVHGNLSATAPYPPNVQVHQWFVKAAILAGLVMIFGRIGQRERADVPRGGAA